MLPGVDHLRHTLDISRNAFSRGEPEHGVELADDLERLVALHDVSTIAAVIVEPVACSTGVLILPKGYLKRLAEEAIDFFRGYSYSSPPVACPACISTQESYKEKGWRTRAAELAPQWQVA